MITHTTPEFAALNSCFALLVAVLDAKGVVDARAIAANIRINANQTEGYQDHLQYIADSVFATIERYDEVGPAGLRPADID